MMSTRSTLNQEAIPHQYSLILALECSSLPPRSSPLLRQYSISGLNVAAQIPDLDDYLPRLTRVNDRYGRDVLASSANGRQASQTHPPEIEAELGMVLECPHTGWVGAITGLQKGPEGWAVGLEDRKGRTKLFLLTDSLLLDGQLITLVRPINSASPAQQRTASGSRALSHERARVARGSRIWVEGKQDAELVEKIWGADLRVEGVVVEELGGADELLAAVREFQPDPGHKLGILLDHLVPLSKEQRIADEVRLAFPNNVLVLGHPYVDVWQAVRPQTLKIHQWPTIPKSMGWKEGVCAHFDWDADTSATWRFILSKVDTFADLEPSLLGRVEELIDFVTLHDA